MHVFRPVAAYRSTDYEYLSLEMPRDEGELVASEMGANYLRGIKQVESFSVGLVGISCSRDFVSGLTDRKNRPARSHPVSSAGSGF